MNGHAPAVDSPACPCWWVIKGRQQGVLPPLTIIRERGIFHDRTRKVSRTYPACANIGQIPNLEKLMATIRGREISACLVLQARSQLKAIYKDNADTIVGNMDSQIFLGGSESTTLKDLSEMLGKETIDAFNTSDTRGNSPSYGTIAVLRSNALVTRIFSPRSFRVLRQAGACTKGSGIYTVRRQHKRLPGSFSPQYRRCTVQCVPGPCRFARHAPSD